MTRCLLVLALAAMLPPLTRAADNIIPIWPEGVPNAQPNGGDEYEKDGRIFNVQRPTLTFYAPDPAKANGTAVIICPGGGYVRLAIGHEGGDIAQWLRSLGVTTFVLKYRLGEYGQPAPLQDVLRAIRLVRSRAAEFHIAPDRIGVFGGSAGGHVATCAGTLYDLPAGKTGAPLDAVSGRPDFLMLVYPVVTMKDPYVHAGSRRHLLGENPSPELIAQWSTEDHVTKDTPPTFLMHTQEDQTVPCENSILFYEALRRAGVPAELHLYEKGAHGVGMAPGHGTTSDWPQQAAAWLRMRGLLPPAAAAAQ